jgi:hypothetical protein
MWSDGHFTGEVTMAQQQGKQSKGNGASHRMSNPRRKARFAECYLRGQKRAAARNAVQQAAHKANLANGGMTPWQLAKAARKADREYLITRYGSMEGYREHVAHINDIWADSDIALTPAKAQTRELVTV